MVVLINGTHTSYSTALAPNGTIPESHQIRSVVSFMESLAPQETNILTAIGFGEELDQRKPEWGVGEDLPTVTTFAEAVNNTTQTEIRVANGDGALFQKYQVLIGYKRDAYGLADYSRREMMWVNGIPNSLQNGTASQDFLPVQRAVGGTTKLEFVPGDPISIAMTAYPEGQDFVISPDAYGKWYYNYFQAFQKGARITKQANVIPNYENRDGNHIARMMVARGKRIRRELQAAVISGGRQLGNPNLRTPSMMGGMTSYVTAGQTVNLNGLRLSPYDIENEGAKLWDTTGEGGEKKLLMSMHTARLLDGLLNRYRVATMRDTEVDLRFQRFVTRFGTFEIAGTRDIPEGIILGVNFSNLKVHPFRGMAWQEFEHPVNGAYMQRSIFGEYTLVVQHPETMFMLYGFDTNPDNYGRRL